MAETPAASTLDIPLRTTRTDLYEKMVICSRPQDPRTPTPLQDGRRYAGRLNPQALPALPRKAVPGILSRLE